RPKPSAIVIVDSLYLSLYKSVIYLTKNFIRKLIDKALHQSLGKVYRLH
ncbi:MAG: hypothetical protein ACI8O8_001466, partial [Oleiphilaceae bacterium]